MGEAPSLRISSLIDQIGVTLSGKTLGKQLLSKSDSDLFLASALRNTIAQVEYPQIKWYIRSASAT
jgi:hypothetical protein